MGVELNDNTILYNLNFEDDQVVIVQDKKDLEFMERRLFKKQEE